MFRTITVGCTYEVVYWKNIIWIIFRHVETSIEHFQGYLLMWFENYSLLVTQLVTLYWQILLSVSYMARVMYWQKLLSVSYTGNVMYWQKLLSVSYTARVMYWQKLQSVSYTASIIYWQNFCLLVTRLTNLYWQKLLFVCYTARVMYWQNLLSVSYTANTLLLTDITVC